ncbi:MAG TPA: Uma2 family endonuclease [Blastocatellia bacterium]|nr:Uma2 family endonuclease [Blastocatellia bacterium]
MSANLQEIRHYYTLEEYLDFIKTNDGRYEYRDGEIVLMGGGSKNHSTIMINLNESLARQLKGCRVIPADVPIKTSHHPFRYADLSVACNPQLEERQGIGVLLNPALIIEILSPSSLLTDNKQKLEEYTALESLQDYLIIAQSIPYVVRYSRLGEGWVRSYFGHPEAVVDLPAIGVRLPFPEIYAGVEFI